MMFFKRFSGWEEINSAQYQHAYSLYGGNILTHPVVLEFQHINFCIRHRYMAKTNHRGDIIGAICIWDEKYLANDPSYVGEYKKIPVPRDELILPIQKGASCFLPVSSKFISGINIKNIKNCFSGINKRKICIVTTKYKNSRSESIERKLRKLNYFGGKILDCTELDIETLTDAFFHLTEIRWGRFYGNKDITRLFLKVIKPFLFGNVIYLNGEPLAFNLTTKVEKDEMAIIEYIHSGTNLKLVPLKISPGEILIYSNIKKAFSAFGDNVRYSFGNPSRDYKKRWCQMVPLGRVVVI